MPLLLAIAIRFKEITCNIFRQQQPFRVMNENQKSFRRKQSVAAICNLFKVVGNSFTLIGCSGIALGLSGAYDLDLFSYGLSSGIRIVGSIAIAGCLLSAIGYGVTDLFLN
jgi:hypothetical protein